MSNGETKNGLLVDRNREPGRPTYTDEQYAIWLENMRPYLAKGSSLYYAIQQCALLQFQTTIYEKYRAKDWFSQKIDDIRSTVGDVINNFHITEALRIADKAKQGQQILKEEYDEMRFVAEKHRLAQPFFVSRQEQKEAKDDEMGKVLDPQPVSIEYKVPEKEPEHETEKKEEAPPEQKNNEKLEEKPHVPTPSEQDESGVETFDVS